MLKKPQLDISTMLVLFLNKPMTQAVEKIIQLLPFIMDSSKVCQACKDSRKCNNCAFNIKELSEDEQYKILAALFDF